MSDDPASTLTALDAERGIALVGQNEKPWAKQATVTSVELLNLGPGFALVRQLALTFPGGRLGNYFAFPHSLLLAPGESSTVLSGELLARWRAAHADHDLELADSIGSIDPASLVLETLTPSGLVRLEWAFIMAKRAGQPTRFLGQPL